MIPLQLAAQRSRRMLGTYIPPDMISPSADLLVRECSYLSPTGLYWTQCQPTQGNFDFSTFDAWNDWAKARGLKTRGLQVIYPDTSVTPQWLLDELTATPANWQSLMEAHFDGLAAHVGSDPGFLYWEIVNEAFLTDQVYRGYWHDAAGDGSFIDHAFTYARSLWPNTPLVLNEARILMTGHAQRRANMLSHLQTAIGAGVPIDAIGIQAHLRWGSQGIGGGYHGGIDKTAVAEWLGEIASLGLYAVITELDAGPDWGWTELTNAQVDAGNAKLLRQALNVIFDNIDVPYINLWGLTDEHATYIPDPELRRYGLFDNAERIKRQGRAFADAMLSNVRVGSSLS